jgi:hypothetical protein
MPMVAGQVSNVLQPRDQFPLILPSLEEEYCLIGPLVNATESWVRAHRALPLF